MATDDSTQGSASAPIITSFPLLEVYALSATINHHLSSTVEELLGEKSTEDLRRYIVATLVNPAEYEHIKPLGEFDIGPSMILDDRIFAEYFPEKCYAAFSFRVSKDTARDLKRLSAIIGVPRSQRTSQYRLQMQIQVTLNMILRFGAINPVEEADKWEWERWSAYLSEHPYIARQALILSAIHSIRSSYSDSVLGPRLSAALGGSFLEEMSVTIIGNDDQDPDDGEDSSSTWEEK